MAPPAKIGEDAFRDNPKPRLTPGASALIAWRAGRLTYSSHGLRFSGGISQTEGLLMIDWGQVLEIVVAGAPAAAFMLVAGWLVWSVIRLVRGIRAAFRRRFPAKEQPPAPSSHRVRIEPVIDSGRTPDHEAHEGADHHDITRTLRALTERIEDLEMRVSSLRPSEGTAPRLRLVTDKDLVPSQPS
jgi:hypothetical protein